MFLGSYLVRVTSGSRTSIPSYFREKLGDSFILAKWYEGCLVLIAKDTWQVLLTRLTAGVNNLVSPVRGTERFIFAESYELSPDEQGRIVIPDSLFKYAEFKDEVYFLGVRDRVEIWDKDTWESERKKLAKSAPEYIEELAKDARR